MRRLPEIDPIVPVNRLTGGPLEVPTDGPREWDYSRWLICWVFTRPEWQKGIARHRATNKILDSLATREIEPDLWRMVRDSVEAEDFFIPAPLGPQLLPLADAWLGASSE